MGNRVVAGFCGAGMMGGSMLQSLKSSSTCVVRFYDIDVDRVAALNTALGMTSFYCNSNAAVANNSNVVVLAIEPKGRAGSVQRDSAQFTRKIKSMSHSLRV